MKIESAATSKAKMLYNNSGEFTGSHCLISNNRISGDICTCTFEYYARELRIICVSISGRGINEPVATSASRKQCRRYTCRLHFQSQIGMQNCVDIRVCKFKNFAGDSHVICPSFCVDICDCKVMTIAEDSHTICIILR